MALLFHRRNEIDRIEARIESLRDRSTQLFDIEQRTTVKVEDLRRRSEESLGRVRRRRVGVATKRAQTRLERVRSERNGMVDGELRAIMMALQEQSKRTRMRLDRELSRLEPVAAEWERMRATFDALEAIVTTPALEQLTAQLQGELAIPEFPVHEQEGYAKPFPQRAVVF